LNKTWIKKIDHSKIIETVALDAMADVGVSGRSSSDSDPVKF
jgi:hypothetical protein